MATNLGNYSPGNPVRPHRKHGAVQHGVAHMTAASRQIHALAFGTARAGGGGTRRRRKKSKPDGAQDRARARGHTARAARSGKRAHMVKGSAAAKAHMAKLRRMVGKKRA